MNFTILLINSFFQPHAFVEQSCVTVTKHIVEETFIIAPHKRIAPNYFLLLYQVLTLRRLVHVNTVVVIVTSLFHLSHHKVSGPLVKIFIQVIKTHFECKFGIV